MAQPAESPATAEYLRCEYRVNPLGIDVIEPRLSWEMNDGRRGAAQTAYQVLVASDPEKLAADQGNLWDSGKIQSDQSSQVVYAGKALKSRMRCRWKVRIWDADGKATAFSKPALWTMGLLQPEDMKAKWIGLKDPMIYSGKGPALSFEGCPWVWYPEPGKNARQSAPKGTRVFRHTVSIPADRVVSRARFLITADDGYELFVNVKPAGRGAGYNQPQVAEITNHLVPGKNTLAISATNGSDGPAGLVGRVVIDLDNGQSIVQNIDAAWKSFDKTVANWNRPDFDDSAWPKAVVIGVMGDQPWGKQEAKSIDVLGCPLLRKEFRTEKPVRRAIVYASALGNYILHVNGRRVGNDYFSPGWTDYKKRVYYNTYDVTDLVNKDGPNAIGGILAAGWYAGAIGWKADRFNYGADPRLWVQLELEADDGSLRTVTSDGSWKAAWGPYLEGEFLAGETYDARKEIPGWDQPGLNDSAWMPVAVGHVSNVPRLRRLGLRPDPVSVGTESSPAAVGTESQPTLQAQPSVLVEATGELKPVKITQQRPGVFIFDMGQIYAGVVRLKAKGPAGTKIVLRFAEILNPDGSIYTTNLRGARATDTYILKGGGEETWQPSFTFHGFRYVEVAGYPGTPTAEAITGVPLNSATPLVGSFECSSPMVNRLYQNIVWTQRANFISIPTDCPQRDERLGWTGDAEVFVRAATYSADVASFFTKWLVDLEDAQRPGGGVPDVAPDVLGLGAGTAAWADAGTICPWTIYHVYNDKRLLAKHYGMMCRLVEFDRANSKGLLRPAAGYGDWLSIGADTPKDVIATAFFAYSTRLTAQAARILGKEGDARKYEKLFDDIKKAFNTAYVAADGRIKGDTQTCYVMALYFDLLPPDKRKAAATYLVADISAKKSHLSTGFIGTSMLMPVLAETDNQAVAYRLLLNDTYPSWGYSIKHGATSIWERWDGWTADKGFQDPGMNSFAHYSFGAVARWMFQSVAGIDTDGPGFKRLIIRPKPGPGLTWVKASYRSLHGLIASEWKLGPDHCRFNVTLPPNAVARTYIPASNVLHVEIDGKRLDRVEGVKFLRQEPGAVVCEIRAGKYEIMVRDKLFRILIAK
jgi:alpha-L-rhamnosidase